jgi:hypothetical protein
MDSSEPTIFVSIASYCDPELPRTLDDCLANARNPQNLRFGICWQYDAHHQVDLRRFESDSRFRFSKYPVQESEGGSWARNIAQQLFDGETYTMQIDSHMAFAPGWDSSLVNMMRSLPSDKPLITMIAPLFRIHEDGRIRKQTDLGIRGSRMADWREETGWAPWFDWGMASNGNQSRNRFISGQFIFTHGVWTDDVRQDPEHYYWGEEFALSLRSFTHGYDFFLPDKIVAWHMEHVKAPPRRHWEHGSIVVSTKNKIAFERLRKLAYSNDLDDSNCLARYGLGSERTLVDYERFAGIDLANKRAHPDAYAGRSPDPLTIREHADWADCQSFKAYSSSSR